MSSIPASYSDGPQLKNQNTATITVKLHGFLHAQVSDQNIASN
jgi:hypothetical protein